MIYVEHVSQFSTVYMLIWFFCSVPKQIHLCESSKLEIIRFSKSYAYRDLSIQHVVLSCYTWTVFSLISHLARVNTSSRPQLTAELIRICVGMSTSWKNRGKLAARILPRWTAEMSSFSWYLDWRTPRHNRCAHKYSEQIALDLTILCFCRFESASQNDQDSARFVRCTKRNTCQTCSEPTLKCRRCRQFGCFNIVDVII